MLYLASTATADTWDLAAYDPASGVLLASSPYQDPDFDVSPDGALLATYSSEKEISPQAVTEVARGGDTTPGEPVGCIVARWSATSLSTSMMGFPPTRRLMATS